MIYAKWTNKSTYEKLKILIQRERKREPYPPLLSYGDQLACCFVMVSEGRVEYTERRGKIRALGEEERLPSSLCLLNTAL